MNAEVVVNPTDTIAPHSRIMTLLVLAKTCMIHADAVGAFPVHVRVFSVSRALVPAIFPCLAEFDHHSVVLTLTDSLLRCGCAAAWC